MLFFLCFFHLDLELFLWQRKERIESPHRFNYHTYCILVEIYLFKTIFSYYFIKIMNLIIQHEYYKEILSEKWLGRDIELDAIDADQEEEKHYG